MKFNSDTPGRASKAGAPLAPAYAFDRLTLWFDRPQLLISRRALQKEAASIRFFSKQMHYHINYTLKMEVYQPTPAFLRLLLVAVGGEISALITYVEVACDIAVTSSSAAALLQDRFAAVAWIRHLRQPVIPDRGTDYFGRRNKVSDDDAARAKRQTVVAVYSDKVSKLSTPAKGRKCLHVELRVSGGPAVARLGGPSIQDLMTLDLADVLDRHLVMMVMPSMTKQGQILGGPGGRAVSDAALRKRARSAHQLASKDGRFFMQHLLQMNPKLARAFPRERFSRWARSCTDSDTHI